MKLFCHYWKSESESEEKTRIVFLHGMGGTGALWRPVASVLEDDCEILAPDQRGHGKSQIPPGARVEPTYTPLDYAQDIVETLQNLGFHPTWIVGHSMGVRTACAAAHLKPEWARGLVLVDLGLSGEAGGALGQELERFLRVLPMQFPDRQAARAFMERECPDPAMAQYLLAVASLGGAGGRALSFPFDKSALIQTIIAAERAARDSSVRDWVLELAARGMPILVLRGERSLVWSHEEFEAERERFVAFPSVRFEEMPGAGHGLPFEQRVEFVRRLREFVGKASQP